MTAWNSKGQESDYAEWSFLFLGSRVGLARAMLNVTGYIVKIRGARLQNVDAYVEAGLILILAQSS